MAIENRGNPSDEQSALPAKKEQKSVFGIISDKITQHFQKRTIKQAKSLHEVAAIPTQNEAGQNSLKKTIEARLSRRRFLALAGAAVATGMSPDFRIGVTRPIQSADLIMNPSARARESSEQFVEDSALDHSWNGMTETERASVNNSKDAWEYAYSGFARLNEIFFKDEPETAIFDHVHDMCRKMDIPLAVGMLFLNHSGQVKGIQLGDIAQSTIQAGLGGISEATGTREEVGGALIKQRRWGELLSSRIVSSHRTTGVMDTEEIVRALAYKELPDDLKSEIASHEDGKYAVLISDMERVLDKSAAVQREKGHLKETIDQLLADSPDILNHLFSDTAGDTEWAVVTGTALVTPSTHSRYTIEAVDMQAPLSLAITKTREFWTQQFKSAEEKTDVLRSFMIEQWTNSEFWSSLGEQAAACRDSVDNLNTLYQQLHDANIESSNSGASLERDSWIEYTLALAIARRNIRIASDTFSAQGFEINRTDTPEGVSNLATMALMPRDAITGYQAVQNLGITMYNPLEDAPVFPYEIAAFMADRMKKNGYTEPAEALMKDSVALGIDIYSVHVYQRELQEFINRAVQKNPLGQQAV